MRLPDDHDALLRTYRHPDIRRIVCVGFPAWKQGYVPRFIRAEGTTVAFARNAAAADRALREGDAVLVWGTQTKQHSIAALAERRGAPLWRMEDGFLRSVGLGSDLEEPVSLVIDTLGIYYDPGAPSDLERTLAAHEFHDDEIRRAEALRAAIVEHGISKYNIGTRCRVGPARSTRDVALVVGQVEDDASVERGAVDIRRNEALLRAARIARPHAYLLYKPHPDVVRGNREDSLPVSLARRLSDEVVLDASLADCLAAADEVHTITSLVGFEALLRGKRVHTYGQPFYAGWGLTEDRHPHPRRTRTLTLSELVAATLIRYPRYVHPVTGRYTSPEAIVRHLRESSRAGPLTRLGPIRRQLRRLRNIVEGALSRAR